MNTENAYKAIVLEAMAEAGNVDWDELIADITIYAKATKATFWVKKGDKKFTGNGDAPTDVWHESLKAVLFLRDNLLETTGERIWGLTLTYHKNGKFNIDYSYDMPEGYVE